jgi:hypothetical protein
MAALARYADEGVARNSGIEVDIAGQLAVVSEATRGRVGRSGRPPRPPLARAPHFTSRDRAGLRRPIEPQLKAVAPLRSELRPVMTMPKSVQHKVVLPSRSWPRWTSPSAQQDGAPSSASRAQ